MKRKICHHDQLHALRRIEGQIRGVQKMIENERYCIDIMTAIAAVMGALRRVEGKILKDHLRACVKTAFEGKSESEKEKKLDEIYGLLKNLKL